VNSTDSYQANSALSTRAARDGDTERVVDVYPDDLLLMSGGDGTDRNAALTGYYTVRWAAKRSWWSSAPKAR
jgi:hypothetical protein